MGKAVLIGSNKSLRDLLKINFRLMKRRGIKVVDSLDDSESNSKVGDLQLTIDAQNENEKLLTGKIEELSNSLADRDHKIEDFDDRVANQEAQIKSLKKTNDELFNDNSSFADTVDKLNETINQNSKDIQVLTDRKDELVREDMETKSDLSKAKIKIQDLEKKIEKSKKASK